MGANGPSRLEGEGQARLAADFSALRESEARFHALFEATGTPYLVLAADAPRFTITDVNSAYLKVTMSQREALIGRGVFEAFPGNPDDPGAIGVRDLKASFERVLATRRPDAMAVLKYDIRRPDGTFEERHWIPRNTPVLNREGEPVGIIHHAEDVSEYVRLHARAAEGDQKAERLEAEIVAAGQRLQRINERLRASEERQTFLLKLSDALRPLANPDEIEAAVTQAAMDHFAADRCYYCEIEGSEAIIRREAASGNLPSVAGRYPLDSFGIFKAAMAAGHALVVEDVRTSGKVDESLRRLCLQLRVISFLNVPVIKNGKAAGIFCLAQSTPRDWTDLEVKLARETADRTWAAVERARAESALREAEEQYRILFDSIDEGFCVIEVLFDANDAPVDYRFLQTNPAFEDQTGLRNAVGRRMRDLVPEHEQHWFDVYGRIALTGEPARFESEAAALGRWYDVYAFRVGEPEQRRVAILFRDVVERKRAEQHRELLIHELNHRVKNTLASVQSVAALTLRNAESTKQAREVLDDRLIALSRAHDVLTRENWESAGLREVVVNAAAAYASTGHVERFEIEGPDLRLRPNAVLALSMALHELATNALKYGALSNDEGRVAIRWCCGNAAGQSGDKPDRFQLRWTETGGPPVEKEPARRGFGSRLIEEGLAHDLGGAVRLDFASTGLVCEIAAPLGEIRGLADEPVAT